MKKTTKPKQSKAKPRKYAGRLSLWPLRAEDALAAFMQVNPEKVKEERTK